MYATAWVPKEEEAAEVSEEEAERSKKVTRWEKVLGDPVEFVCDDGLEIGLEISMALWYASRVAAGEPAPKVDALVCEAMTAECDEEAVERLVELARERGGCLAELPVSAVSGPLALGEYARHVPSSIDDDLYIVAEGKVDATAAWGYPRRRVGKWLAFAEAHVADGYEPTEDESELIGAVKAALEAGEAGDGE